ncbi:LCP family protein required for cell wall assembly [Catenulispora sp. MAP12-49]|uniref:LCP family protein n=1 Tax=Catenulispora sp. MAP12-49 TaxID=3156302 RepID=UPI00351625B1
MSDDASGIDGDTSSTAWVPKHSSATPQDGTAATAQAGKTLRRVKRTLMVLSGMLVLVIGGTVAYAGYWYYRIDHNIKGAPLHGAVVPPEQLASGGGIVQPTPDPYGDVPINILLIGTDARLPGQDAALGGFTDPSGRSDVEMLVHVSADRSNATVVSLPRDTMIPIPACVDAKGNQYPAQSIGMINSALAAGPGCQVDTVEEFTHVKIDHFMMVDFAGVVALTNAVGGVPVCVTKAVNDPDSHLNLPAGTSTIQGDTALAFLRTREGFADGSDLYRTEAQHQYLSALIRKMKDQATFDNPIQATHLMDIASKSLTVDDGIASVSKLLDLANTLKKVPTQNITFLTMPTTAYAPDPNRVAPDTALDDQIFSLIAHDQSVTGPTTAASGSAGATPGTPSPTPQTTSSSLRPSSVTDAIVVENGTSNDGRSRQLAATLQADGFKNASGVGYSSTVATTTVYYSGQAHQAAAEAVAAALQLPASAVQPGTDGSAPIVVRVGSDFASGDVFNPAAASSSSSPSALPSAALSSADGENAADPNLCVAAAGSQQ